ncbi:hypothetical protein LPJ54_004574, partial [Coemansia sp. RSA 1824]
MQFAKTIAFAALAVAVAAQNIGDGTQITGEGEVTDASSAPDVSSSESGSVSESASETDS